jgi:diguanylate cyclase
MRFKIANWRDVFIYSMAITVLSVAVPVVTLGIGLMHVPLRFQIMILIPAGIIPFFIALPVSIFALNLMRNMNAVTARLDLLVQTDPMTGLFNRSHFLRLVQEKRCKQGFYALADADHFKSINDTHGHEAGDRALQHLARHMSQVFGPYGIVGRLGGEEFGIYLPKLSNAQARLLFAALSTALRTDPMIYEGKTVSISISMGFAPDQAGKPLAEISRLADRCLYAAKAAGRDCGFVMNEVDEPVQLAA